MGKLSLSQPPPDRSWLHRALSLDDPLPEPGPAHLEGFPLRRRKGRAQEYLNAKQWRTDNVPVGYRNLARFEAAAHFWLCLVCDHPCSCTPEYVAWFEDQFYAATWIACRAMEQGNGHLPLSTVTP